MLFLFVVWKEMYLDAFFFYQYLSLQIHTCNQVLIMTSHNRFNLIFSGFDSHALTKTSVKRGISVYHDFKTLCYISLTNQIIKVRTVLIYILIYININYNKYEYQCITTKCILKCFITFLFNVF